MKSKFLPLLLVLAAPSSHAALISLNDVTPGTETVSPVANGGFEIGTGSTNPDSWSRGGDALYDTTANSGLGLTNLPGTGKIAYIKSVIGTNKGGNYRQTVSGLDASTEYVFSAYLWNNSASAYGTNRNLVMDMNDNKPEAPIGDGATIQEVQFVLGGGTADAADGYFVYQTFNTSDTDTSFDVRIFGQPTTHTFDGLAMFAWDNVAITKASDFVAPTLVPEPSTALLACLGGMLGLLRRRRG